jgi:hypothetical protein
MESRSMMERINELMLVFAVSASRTRSWRQLSVLPAALPFIDVNVEQLGRPECQMQGEPGSRIADIASDQLTDSP